MDLGDDDIGHRPTPKIGPTPGAGILGWRPCLVTHDSCADKTGSLNLKPTFEIFTDRAPGDKKAWKSLLTVEPNEDDPEAWSNLSSPKFSVTKKSSSQSPSPSNLLFFLFKQSSGCACDPPNRSFTTHPLLCVTIVTQPSKPTPSSPTKNNNLWHSNFKSKRHGT